MKTYIVKQSEYKPLEGKQIALQLVGDKTTTGEGEKGNGDNDVKKPPKSPKAPGWFSGAMKTALNPIETRLDRLEARLTKVEMDVSELKTDVSGLKVAQEKQGEFNQVVTNYMEEQRSVNKEFTVFMKDQKSINKQFTDYMRDQKSVNKQFTDYMVSHP